MSRKKTPPAPNCFIFSPRDFDPADHPGPIAEFPLAARWLLSTIFIERVSGVHRSRSSFSPLKAEYLLSVMGSSVPLPKIRNALIDAGMVECDGKSTPCIKCLGYRLTEPYTRKGVWKHYSIANKWFVARVEKARRVIKENSGENPELTAYMGELVNRVEFAPTVLATLEMVDDTPYGPRKDGLPHEFESRREFARYQHEVIEGGYRRFKRTELGRFFFSFTTLSRELRPHLMIDGQPLIEVDIAASQVFMMGCLVERGLGAGNKGGNRGEREGKSNHSRFVPSELEKLFSDATSGEFYEQFLEVGNGISRDEAKVKVFQVLMGSVHLMTSSPVGRRLRKLYPSVFAEIVRMKTDNELADKGDPKPFRHVARLLQKAESEIVIDGVAETLRLRHPEIPFLSIHDSLMVPARFVPLVRRLLEENFQRKYGRVPRLKSKTSTALLEAA